MKEVLVVGAGFFGLTVARLVAEELGVRVRVLDTRAHVGGNSWSDADPSTGIEIHRYGSHIFHTNRSDVWDFVNRFGEFNNYRHRVISKVGSEFLPMPVNLQTIAQIYGEPLTPERAREVISKDKVQLEGPPGNFEEAALAAVGKPLYEALFKGYTHKQWQTDPRDLPAEVFNRLPVRLNFNSDYFDDEFQGIPVSGYGELLTSLSQHELIAIELEQDFFSLNLDSTKYLGVVYTGPIDRYFNYCFGPLGWRTLDFELEWHDVDDFQGTAVVNYPDLDYQFTRIHEFSHYLANSPDIGRTVVMKEFSRFADRSDSPYYPINSASDRSKLEKYRKLAGLERGVYFGGRLGTYKYLDMHMAIASAFSLFRNTLKDELVES